MNATLRNLFMAAVLVVMLAPLVVVAGVSVNEKKPSGSMCANDRAPRRHVRKRAAPLADDPASFQPSKAMMAIGSVSVGMSSMISSSTIPA